MSAAQPFRWAILGTGGVARKFVLDLKQAGATAQIVASRDPENARRFAKSLGLPEAAPSYDDAVSAAVDAVYIATPPAQHEAHALMAIAAGKPVLIEKPFALDARAARRIVLAAREAGVFCMEAMWTRFQPLIETIAAHIAAGELGEIRGFEARFCAATIPDAGSSLFDPERGGGGLMHRGIYPLSVARHLLGPIDAEWTAAHLGDTGVDEESCLTLRHSSGALSTIRSSLRANGPDGVVIYGTAATAYLAGPVYRPTGGHIQPTSPAPAATGQAGPRRFEAFRESTAGLRVSRMLHRLRGYRGAKPLSASFKGNGYHYQAQAVADAVRKGDLEEPRMPLGQSLELMEVVDRARAAWGMMP